jgi:type I restriction enzyme, S subunit
MVSELQIALFGDLYAISSKNGLMKPKRIRGNGYKFINMGEIFAYDRMRNIPCDRAPATDKELQNASLQPGDLLFARQSLVLSGAGKCSLFIEDDEEVIFESHLIRVRLDTNIVEPEYIYYFFKSSAGRSEILSITEQGAGQSGIRGSDLRNVRITFPALSHQRKIVEQLSVLDDLIELNKQINQTLESTTQTIFKSWFVDFDPTKAKMEDREPQGMNAETAAMFPDSLVESEFGMIPEGWEVKLFGEVVTKSSNRVGDLDVPEFSSTNSGLKPRDDRYTKKLSKSTSKNKLIREGDLIFGLSRQILNFGLMRERIGSVSPVYHVYSINKSEIVPDFIERFMRMKMGYYYQQLINPSSREGQSVSAKLFIKTAVIVPPKDILKSYYAIHNSIFNSIDHNTQESETLVKIRELLLPKLISGEIQIPSE